MSNGQTFDKERLSLNIARLKKGGENFEIIISDPDKAVEFRHGKEIPISDIMNGDTIFKDARKGERSPSEVMQKWFGTTDSEKVAEIIIKKGDLNITAEQKKKMAELKRKQIIQYIHENAVDPKNKMPHPINRIELAMEQARVQIDPSDKVEWMIDKIVPQLRTILPISFERAQLKITIPAKYAGSAYSSVKGKYKMSNEKWNADGSVTFDLDIVAGSKEKITNLLNKLTNGEVLINE